MPEGGSLSLSGENVKVLSEEVKAVAKNYRATICHRMKSLGVYRKEYDGAVDVLAQLLTQYNELTQRFEESGYRIAEVTATGSKKAPIVTTLESLRKDILAYLNALGLTPMGAKKIDAAGDAGKPLDPFAKALEAMDDDSG